MRFAPKVAFTSALVSICLSPVNWHFAIAAEGSTAVTTSSTTSASTSTPVDPRLSIDSRLGRLDRRIKEAATHGRLSLEEADNYTSAIGQIAEEEAVYVAVSGQVGPVMQARLELALARLEKRFDSSLHDRRLAIMDLDGAANDLQQVIDLARQQGRLQVVEATQLQNELKSTRDLESTLRNDGLISYGDALVVSMRLDRVQEHFGKLLEEPTLSVPSVEEAANQVSTTLASGKLSVDQTNAFRKQYDALTSQLVKIKNLKDLTVKAQQQLWLASQFELLGNRIAAVAAGNVVAISPSERQQQIDYAIADAFVYGKLTPAETHELRAELQGIINEMGTDTAVAPEKATRIALELERLAGQTNRWLHSPYKTWAGLDAFQAGVDHRVEESLQANRLTAEQAATYRQAAEKLSKQEADLRAAHNGRLNATEALDLAMQIERLSVELHHDKKDRDLTVPDIDALQRELDRVVAEGVDSGRLSPNSARWTERLNHITELRSNFAASPEGLDPRARLAIADTIAMTIADAEAEIHRDTPAEPSLDLRLDQLGDMISNAVATGILSIERGAQYRAGVDTIYSQLSADRKSDNGLTAAESLATASDTNLMASQLYEDLRDSAMFAPMIAIGVDDLQSRIGKAVANGRLTIGEANELMLEVGRKLAAINYAAGAQGGISHGEGLKLAYDVRRLRGKFESLLHDNPVPMNDVTQRAQVLDIRLANALAAGQLTIPEAQQYKTSLDRVLNSSAMYRDTDSGMSYPEALALTIELDQLGSTVEKGIQRDNSNRDVDSRESELKRRISSLVSAGKLSQKDADDLLYDLDRIEQSEAAFRISDEGLNYAEALTLALDLDRLATRIDGMTKASVTTIQQPKHR